MLKNIRISLEKSNALKIQSLLKKRLFGRKRQAFGITLLIFLLTGCQTRTSIHSTEANSLESFNHWQLKARIAIRSPENSLAATLDWQKQAQNFDFHIYGTFGITYAHLIQKGTQATLKMPENQIFYHQDAQQLLQQSLGWDFPIEALSYWIKGQASGKKGEQIKRYSDGKLSEIHLNDWQVKFSAYKNYSGYSMPKIIKASHPQLSLKVVVKKWLFFPTI